MSATAPCKGVREEKTKVMFMPFGERFPGGLDEEVILLGTPVFPRNAQRKGGSKERGMED